MKNLNSGDGAQLPLNVPSEGLIEMLEQRITFLKRGIAQLNEASIDLSKKLATSAEVCAFLNISDRTLKSLRDNRLIGFSQVGRKIFYSAVDIQRYINTFERVDVSMNYSERPPSKRNLKTNSFSTMLPQISYSYIFFISL